jgi:hypothetical protein
MATGFERFSEGARKVLGTGSGGICSRERRQTNHW